MTDDSLLLPEYVEIWQQTLNWQPTAEQQRQFQTLYAGILAGNRQFNLTRIAEPEAFWEKHLWDSLRGVAPLLASGTPQQRVIDLGTGAGFPGLPVAIAFPTSSLTLLDATRKKINFLDTLVAHLGLENATPLVGRAEAIAKTPHRQAYDLALVRAVGTAAICAEYALPLLKAGGLAILYRGHWTTEETEALKPSVEELGGEIESVEGFTTPISHSVRHCLYLRKQR